MDSFRTWLAQDYISERGRSEETSLHKAKGKNMIRFEGREARRFAKRESIGPDQKEWRKVKTEKELRRRRRNGGSYEIKRRESHWGSIAIIRLSSRCSRYCLALFIGPWCIVLRKGLDTIRPSRSQKLSCRRKWKRSDALRLHSR